MKWIKTQTEVESRHPGLKKSIADKKIVYEGRKSGAAKVSGSNTTNDFDPGEVFIKNLAVNQPNQSPNKTYSYEDLNECYRVYEKPDDINTAMHNKKKYHIWITHFFEEKYSPTEQRDYELYCGGWLNYYDLVVIDGEDDHSIYFKWTDKYVIIFISESKPFKKQRICFDLAIPTGQQDPHPPTGPPPPGRE